MRSIIWTSSLAVLLVALSTVYTTPVLAQSGVQPASESRVPKQTEGNKPFEERTPKPSSTSPSCTESDCNSLYFYAGGATEQAAETIAGASEAFTKDRADVKDTSNFSHATYGGDALGGISDAMNGIASYGVVVRDGAAGSSAANAVAPASILVARSGSADNGVDSDHAASGETSDALGSVAAPATSATILVASDGTGDDGVDSEGATNEQVIRGGASDSNAADDGGEGEPTSFELAGFETGTSLLELSTIALLTAVSPLALVRPWVLP
jgi:hypothetical protein